MPIDSSFILSTPAGNFFRLLRSTIVKENYDSLIYNTKRFYNHLTHNDNWTRLAPLKLALERHLKTNNASKDGFVQKKTSTFLLKTFHVPDPKIHRHVKIFFLYTDNTFENVYKEKSISFVENWAVRSVHIRRGSDYFCKTIPSTMFKRTTL